VLRAWVYSYCSEGWFRRGMNAVEERDRRLLTQPTKRDARCIIKRYVLVPPPRARLSSTHKWTLTLGKVQSEMHIDSRRLCKPDFAWGAHVYARVYVRYRIEHRELVSLICRCDVKMYIRLALPQIPMGESQETIINWSDCWVQIINESPILPPCI